ncbi:fluoroacetate dehalogenase [Sphaerisporangium siamense]|uniref:Haloacetate dehalogenase n=1 Tax=Sphaerisporangium siamense TaxID=795645 RepID=A0A7W7D6N7_9ACTN|nr:alpha/beta hydrolase [Sphaerisporangium siamense]MBB4700969.1 haloacetate dehalogenase [Sphaerisporangium siamense]GII85885.1 fluoroacetate dehalogenase [Sphaerisporangium siamense]
MFAEFESRTVDTGRVRIAARIGGSGPPLLLLHGFPQTHAMWHAVAPALAADFTVVAADLRGYGDSGKPPAADDHSTYAKREMARDQVALMERLGFRRFHLAGHDRGGRCAYRLALDHPGRVDRLAVLDIVPTLDALDHVDADAARRLWRWFLMAQPSPLPETLIAADPEAFLFGPHAGLFTPEALAEYRRCARDPRAVHAMCEDYRAMFGPDREHDAADRASGRRIASPVLALWGKASHVERAHDVLATWRRWADDVRGQAVACGHFLAEEASEETADRLRAFFTAGSGIAAR